MSKTKRLGVNPCYRPMNPMFFCMQNHDEDLYGGYDAGSNPLAVGVT